MQRDAFLVQQTLTGDEQAFHRLIIIYQADIYALVMSWVKNPDDAKDLVQEIFFEAYRNLASLRQPERFHFWLRQIAKNRSQNWLERKKQDFDQLSDDMIAETPSVDDSLILRETLAKVMQAIDGLPEMEKQLLKERYLDDASYAELQARHGLSYKALNMRLLRAKRKVREQVTKMLAGIAIFSWQDALKKMLLGGVETVKISAKVKIIAIGVGAVLILGGTGIMLWHQQQPEQIISEPAINQAAQKVSVVSSTKPVSSKKDISDKQKLKDNQNEDVQKEQAIVSQDSLEKDGQEKATVKGISEEKKSADSERKIRGMSVEEAHKKGAELKVELNSWLNEAVALGDVILGRIDNASKISDPVAKEAEMELSRQASYRQIELIKKIAQWELEYIFCAEDPDALKPGGWIYELKMKIRPSGVIWSTPVE